MDSVPYSIIKILCQEKTDKRQIKYSVAFISFIYVTFSSKMIFAFLENTVNIIGFLNKSENIDFCIIFSNCLTSILYQYFEILIKINIYFISKFNVFMMYTFRQIKNECTHH